MLDINFIREEAALVKQALRAKGEEADVDHLLELDQKRRHILSQSQALRHKRNEASAAIAQMKSRGEDASGLIKEMRQVSEKIKTLKDELSGLQEEIKDFLYRIPNIPAEDVPRGQALEDNVEVRRGGKPRRFDFEPKPHWDTGKALGLIDFERASKVAGSNFLFYKGAGALLERALVNFMLDLHTQEQNYIELFPPALASSSSMSGTGQLPKLKEAMYKCETDDLFLIPTAEVPLTNIHSGEIIPAEQLPLNYTGSCVCFRREAGAYGQKTKGLTRLHQFNMVGLVKFVRPETSPAQLERLVADAEEVLKRLQLEYRVMKLCTGQLSFAAYKAFALEARSPGLKRWLEVSSLANFTDFQARRLNICFRDETGTLRPVHTLNGAALALPRTMAAILEQYQRKDGSVEVPQVLRPFMHGLEVIEGAK